jgi:hypothetical protein
MCSRLEMKTMLSAQAGEVYSVLSDCSQVLAAVTGYWYVAGTVFYAHAVVNVYFVYACTCKLQESVHCGIRLRASPVAWSSNGSNNHFQCFVWTVVMFVVATQLCRKLVLCRGARNQCILILLLWALTAMLSLYNTTIHCDNLYRVTHSCRHTTHCLTLRTWELALHALVTALAVHGMARVAYLSLRYNYYSAQSNTSLSFCFYQRSAVARCYASTRASA